MILIRLIGSNKLNIGLKIVVHTNITIAWVSLRFFIEIIMTILTKRSEALGNESVILRMPTTK